MCPPATKLMIINAPILFKKQKRPTVCGQQNNIADVEY